MFSSSSSRSFLFNLTLAAKPSLGSGATPSGINSSTLSFLACSKVVAVSIFGSVCKGVSVFCSISSAFLNLFFIPLNPDIAASTPNPKPIPSKAILNLPSATVSSLSAIKYSDKGFGAYS